MSRFHQFRQWLASTSQRTDQGRGQREPATVVLLALVIVLLVALGLLAGCAAPAKPPADGVNPPPGHCLRKRAQIDVTTGTALTVQVCDLWYFGPTREQDTRFQQNRQRLQKD